MNKLLFAVSAIAAAASIIVFFTSEPISAQSATSNTLLQGVKSEQGNYPLGECIKLIYVLQNRTGQPLIYNFSSSKQYDIWVKIGDKEVYRFSKGKMYAMAFTSLVINSNNTKTFEAVWNQKDNDGHEVGPGVYDIYAQLTPAKNPPPLTKGKVRIGVVKIAVVPITIGESIRRISELLGKRVQIQATYRGWQPNANDPNVKDGPPVTRSDWAVCDSSGCMYVTGKIDLDPVKGIGTSVNLIGKLQKTKTGQVYMVLENAVIQKSS